ncbi:hypothetical protein L1987_58174 [Smallanthus sonchifolius]|uniref:Uncharacterized protein n=1 Tax=Smallanthus sonchifolius TaxID=185202 RepID=A0ACB9DEI7_9ASTR|nr:hypothetical protein L1987_58174 [Smallanthus sonchifolius]
MKLTLIRISTVVIRMHTCTGVIMVSLQQHVSIRESNFLPKGPGVGVFLRQANLGSFKACRSLKIEGSLATGRPSTPSFPLTVPEEDIMVEISTLMNWKHFVDRGPWQHLTWMKISAV